MAILGKELVFDRYVTFDFQVTDEEGANDYDYEIIDFAAVLFDGNDLSMVDTFQYYLRPLINKKLSKYCIEKTKIKQETVDGAETFDAVFSKLKRWLQTNKVDPKSKKFAFVTDGSDTLGKYFQLEFAQRKRKIPHLYRRYLNIRKTFLSYFPKENADEINVYKIMDKYEINYTPPSSPSSIENAKYMGEVLKKFLELGYNLQINERLSSTEAKKKAGKIHKSMEYAPVVVKRDGFTENKYRHCSSCDEDF